MTDAPRLGDLPLFRGLSDVEIGELLGHSGTGKVPPRTQLMSIGQPGDLIYVLLRGTVRVQTEQSDGTVVILGYLGPGDVVGEMGVLESAGRSATVTTTEACRYIWFDRSAFRAALETSPRLAFNLMGVLSRRLRLANDRIQSMARNDVAGRVAHQLLGLADAFGSEEPDGSVRIELRLTQTDLADLVGASREHVNRVLGDLAGVGLVTADAKHRFTVHDPEALERRHL